MSRNAKTNRSGLNNRLRDLPRLIYVGDVAVEATVAGSTLLYRLLQEYPPERLLIAEGNLWRSSSEKRLPSVRYESFRVGTERLLRTRMYHYYSSALHLTARSRRKRLKSLFDDFQPEAILTVAHGYSWLTAADLSKQFALPLHLIVHDDWVSIQESVLLARVPRTLRRDFRQVFAQASSRLCVSPYMVADFAAKYGARGTLLYPSRAADAPTYEGVPEKSQTERKVTFAFAGTINTGGHLHSLAALASVLKETNGRLIIYSNLHAGSVETLKGDHLTFKPILPFKEMIESLRKEVDVLFVPMSFAEEDAQTMKVNFPSKLADYTIVGLPILVWGPSSSSAIRWARENPGVAEIVDEPSTEGLKKAVTKLLDDAEHRVTLGAMHWQKVLNSFLTKEQLKSFIRRYYSLSKTSSFRHR